MLNICTIFDNSRAGLFTLLIVFFAFHTIYGIQRKFSGGIN
jgi:hypothetical protein